MFVFPNSRLIRPVDCGYFDRLSTAPLIFKTHKTQDVVFYRFEDNKKPAAAGFLLASLAVTFIH